MIRLLIFLIYALCIVIITPFMFLFMHIFMRKNIHKRDIFVLHFVQWVFKCVLFISGTKIEVKGLENIPEDHAVLYVGNHLSFFDIIVSYIYLKQPTGFVAKKEMLKVPVLRVWMRYVHCLFIDRDNTKEALKTIIEGINNVKEGYSVFIFPEGTRSKDHTMAPFKEGSFKIAEKGKCPIIPVTLCNTHAALEDHFPRIKSAKVTVEFGAPVIISELEGDDKKFVGAYVQKIVADTYEKNKCI